MRWDKKKPRHAVGYAWLNGQGGGTYCVEWGRHSGMLHESQCIRYAWTVERRSEAELLRLGQQLVSEVWRWHENVHENVHVYQTETEDT